MINALLSIKVKYGCAKALPKWERAQWIQEQGNRRIVEDKRRSAK